MPVLQSSRGCGASTCSRHEALGACRRTSVPGEGKAQQGDLGDTSSNRSNGSIEVSAIR
jgi:hypothetical protein